MPDTADAERWLDPDTFVYQGNIYLVDLWGVVRRGIK